MYHGSYLKRLVSCICYQIESTHIYLSFFISCILYIDISRYVEKLEEGK